MADDLKSQLLSLHGLPVMLSHEGLQAFGKADKADGESSVLQHLSHRVLRFQLFGIHPDALLHEKRIIPHLSGALDQITVIELVKYQGDGLV